MSDSPINIFKIVKDEGCGTGATLHFTSPTGDTFVWRVDPTTMHEVWSRSTKYQSFGVEETTAEALEASIREQER